MAIILKLTRAKSCSARSGKSAAAANATAIGTSRDNTTAVRAVNSIESSSIPPSQNGANSMSLLSVTG